MKYFFIFAFATCALAHTIGRTSLEDKIVGGTTASPGQFPYQISQRLNGRHICGGSIIDPNTILTAAHCVDRVPCVNTTIVVGTNTLNQGGTKYQASRFIIHSEWDIIISVNDIAVIKVKTPIQYTTNVQPIAIASTFTPAGAECIFSGWGYTSYPGAPSNTLLYSKGHVVDLKKCQEAFIESEYSEYIIDESNICSFSKFGIGACKGDSGGPLVHNHEVVGLASWVTMCALGDPDVFTRVSYYYDWVKTQQAESS